MSWHAVFFFKERETSFYCKASPPVRVLLSSVFSKGGCKSRNVLRPYSGIAIHDLRRRIAALSIHTDTPVGGDSTDIGHRPSNALAIDIERERVPVCHNGQCICQESSPDFESATGIAQSSAMGNMDGQEIKKEAD